MGGGGRGGAGGSGGGGRKIKRKGKWKESIEMARKIVRQNRRG